MQNAPADYYRDAHRIYSWLWKDSIGFRYLLIPMAGSATLLSVLITDGTYKRKYRAVALPF